jgi:signal transduction histidine kinase
LRLYGSAFDRAIPPAFEGLSAGIHDEVMSDGRQYVALVADVDGQSGVLSLDISDLERSEMNLAFYMAAWTAPVMVALAVIAHFGTAWLVGPLASMARTISEWSPDSVGQRISVNSTAPHEAAIIARALNEYGERLDRFLERERAFINMASHELRTPIAAISSSIDVALDMDPDSKARPHLEEVRRTALDMNRLISLLLSLAKDPSKLRDANEPVDLRRMLPQVARDHEHLANVKNLSLNIDVSGAPIIDAPQQIVRAAVGNLLRNAIENSDCGTISVEAGKPGWVRVTDPGHGMSELEMSRLYTRQARSGKAGESSGGIGIELISRLCDHLGWQLSFESQPGRGTLASLYFTIDAER